MNKGFSMLPNALNEGTDKKVDVEVRVMFYFCTLPSFRPHGVFASEKQIGKALGKSANTIHAALQRLVRKGYLKAKKRVGTTTVYSPGTSYTNAVVPPPQSEQ